MKVEITCFQSPSVIYAIKILFKPPLGASVIVVFMGGTPPPKKKLHPRRKNKLERETFVIELEKTIRPRN